MIQRLRLWWSFKLHFTMFILGVVWRLERSLFSDFGVGFETRTKYIFPRPNIETFSGGKPAIVTNNCRLHLYFQLCNKHLQLAVRTYMNQRNKHMPGEDRPGRDAHGQAGFFCFSAMCCGRASGVPRVLLHRDPQYQAVEMIDKEMNPREAPRQQWLPALDVASTRVTSFCAAVATKLP